MTRYISAVQKRNTAVLLRKPGRLASQYACKAFAEKNGIDNIEIYIDRALSAKTDNRPDFQRLIKESGSKKFEVLLVWKLDRFARNKFDSAHYKRILKKQRCSRCFGNRSHFGRAGRNTA